MMMVDDEMLMQYADGELDDIARARVERAAAADTTVMARLEEHRSLRARLAGHYGPVAEEDVPERFKTLLAAEGAGNVVAFGPARRRRAAPLGWASAAIAASLVAGVIAGQMLPRASGGPVAFENGAMIAQGQVARALETQLASAPPASAAVRIGVSFPGEGGRACRTFDAPELAGVACRLGDRWRVLVTAPGGSARGAGGYRQAGVSDAVVMQVAQDMMSGEPLDAAAERRARDGGWTPDVGGSIGRP